MKFLVTGAGGFIGANVALDLESRGHEVLALDDFSVGVRENLKNLKGRVIAADIRTFDYDSLGRLDGVFHQAAITDTTVMDRQVMMSVNVTAFEKILAYALNKGCPKVVYASSAATYGKGKVPMKEDDSPAPANVYGESKVDMDNAAMSFVKKNPTVSAVGLRYFNVYGPLEFHKKKAASMIYQLYQQVSSGKSPRIFKWGEQYRDFVYVKDVVRANQKAFAFKSSGFFNVGTGLPTTFNQVIGILNRELNGKKPTDYFDNPHVFYQEATQADTALAERRLGFKAAFPPEEGIPDYVRFLKKQETVPSPSPQ